MKLLILNICKLLWSDMVQTEFVEVAKASEIPDWKMKRFEVDGKEVLIASTLKYGLRY